MTGSPHAARPAGRWPAVLPVLLQAAAVVVALALSGVLAGVLWEWWWTPPAGVVVDHQWRQDEQGLRDDFSGTGTYVAVAAVVGLLAGAAVAALAARSELVTLLALVVGSVLAAWLMYQVGLALGPPDPRPLAEAAEDGTRLPGRLRVSGQSPFVAFPSGALLGLVVVFLGLSRRRDTA